MKQCATLSLPRQWPVNKPCCRAQLHPPLILPHLLCLLSLSGGMYPHLKGHCVTHSTLDMLFSGGRKVASLFLLLISASFHLHSLIPRRLWSVGGLVAAIPYSHINRSNIYLQSITESSLEDTSKQCISVAAELLWAAWVKWCVGLKWVDHLCLRQNQAETECKWFIFLELISVIVFLNSSFFFCFSCVDNWLFVSLFVKNLLKNNALKQTHTHLTDGTMSCIGGKKEYGRTLVKGARGVCVSVLLPALICN